MHIHTENCRWVVKGDGKRRCGTARLEREREGRALGLRNRANKRIEVITDGLEDEYGPVPPRVPNTKWLDEVIVLRLLNGAKTGRRPYLLEWEMFFKLNRTTTFKQVLNATGLSPAGLWDHARHHGYRWPRELTDQGKMGKVSL